MTHPTKLTAGPPALSSPVEDVTPMFSKWPPTKADVVAFAARIRAEAVAAEREACAGVAESWPPPQSVIAYTTGRNIAAAIRARGPAPAQQTEGGE